MGLEDFIPQESSEGGAASAEVAEKIREGIKKGAAKAKGVRKDEQKARKYDMSLANFLVKILLEKKYDTLFPSLFGSIHSGVPSNLVMGMISLIYPAISDYIREKTGKIPLEYHFSSKETINFSDSDLPDEVKQRINEWIEDIVDILYYEPSTLLVEKTISCIEENEDVYTFGTQVFIYFLGEANIYIKEAKARDYVDFILRQVIYEKITDKEFRNSLEKL